MGVERNKSDAYCNSHNLNKIRLKKNILTMLLITGKSKCYFVFN